MNDPDERVRRYLRSRAGVPVPDDLRWPSRADDRRPLTALWSSVRWAGLAAAVVVAVVVIRVVVVSTPSPDGTGPRPSGPPATASAGASSPVGAEFPSIVAGMPVVSVAQAVELLQRGDLDGRAVAVAGYFFQAMPSCPAPMRYISPLEDWCRFVAFTDDAASATLCSYGSNSVSCRPPSGTHLAPFIVSETSGALPSASDGKPMPQVLIGHAGDARQWQCAADTQEACGRAFVVDRIAWANGHDVTLTALEPWDQTTGKRLVPRLTMDQATAALDLGDHAVAAAAFRAGDISTVDPRWNLAGDDIVWIVRSIGDGDSSSDATRSVTVSLVDDASGNLVDAHDLALDATYRPARLWTIATTNGIECCAGDVYPFYGVRSGDGTTVHDGMVQGGTYGREDATTYGPGVPLVLSPGTYSDTVWLASLDRGVIGPPTGACSTEVTLGELDDVMLEAVFPAAGETCTFGQPSPPRLTH